MNVIVFESRGTWAAALRKLLSSNLPPLRETRSLAECDAELAAAPTSFVIAELNANSAQSLIERFTVWRRSRPACSLAMVATREYTTWSQLALEAGACLTVFSPRKVTGLIDAIARHAARRSQPTGSLADRIWSELPLANADTSE